MLHKQGWLNSMRLFILLLLLPGFSMAAAVKDFVAIYDLYYNGIYVGKSTRTLKTENHILTFHSLAKSAGLAAIFVDVTINETSKLIYKNDRLQFFSYHYDEVNNDKHDEFSIVRKGKKQIYNSFRQKTFPLVSNLQDQLGFSVTLMHDLRKKEADITYSLADKEQIKNYTLKLLGHEKIDTDAAPLDTVKLEFKDKGNNARFVVWCAPSMDYVPVRILSVTPHGNENMLKLNNYNGRKIYIDYGGDEEQD